MQAEWPLVFRILCEIDFAFLFLEGLSDVCIRFLVDELGEIVLWSGCRDIVLCLTSNHCSGRDYCTSIIKCLLILKALAVPIRRRNAIMRRGFIRGIVRLLWRNHFDCCIERFSVLSQLRQMKVIYALLPTTSWLLVACLI